jgi:hypothetical protein
VAGGNFCWARAVNCLSRFGLTQLFVEVKLQGFPVGLSQFFVRAVVAGKSFLIARGKLYVFVLRWARASFFWSWAFGVFFWVPACCFLYARNTALHRHCWEMRDVYDIHESSYRIMGDYLGGGEQRATD